MTRKCNHENNHAVDEMKKMKKVCEIPHNWNTLEKWVFHCNKCGKYFYTHPILNSEVGFTKFKECSKPESYPVYAWREAEE